MRFFVKGLLAAVAVTAAAASPVHAKFILDVTPTTSTTLSGNAVTGGSFIVANTTIQTTGTGVIDPFLTIQQNGHESGFNTDIGTPLDTKRSGGGYTRAVQLGELATVTVNGVAYYQFQLDVNQSANGPISLNQVQFFVSPGDLGASAFNVTTASQGTGPDGVGGADPVISFTDPATLVFQLNNAENNGTSLAANTEIQIDSGRGSGSGDMFLYVQASLFGNDPNSYVTLYSQFGRPSGVYDSNAGFEEWSFLQGPGTNAVPAPPSVVLALIGLAGTGLGYVGRRRRAALAG
jgi:hypothetical protein